MAKPSMERGPGIYVLRWSEHQVLMRIDRIKDHSDSVSAEIAIKSTIPDTPTHLHFARLNLTSTAAQNTLAKSLAARHGDTIPWGDMLEQTRVMVLEKHREGTPAIKLSSMPVRERLRYRVSPLLVERQTNILYGEGQSGKTYLALYVSLLVAAGLEDSGLTPEPGRVLYLDYETDADEIATRVRKLQVGLGIEPNQADITYRFGRIPLADDIEQIQHIVLEEDIQLVIVDSFGLAAGGDQDKATDIIRFYQALRSLERTSCILDHKNKEGLQYGNIYKYNEARCVWEVRGHSEAGQDKLQIALHHRKMNNGRRHPPIGFTFEWAVDDQSVAVSRMDVASVPELAIGMPLRLQIQAALSHGALSIAQIADEIGAKEVSIRGTLYRYKEDFQPVYTDGQREHVWGLRAVSTP